MFLTKIATHLRQTCQNIWPIRFPDWALGALWSAHMVVNPSRLRQTGPATNKLALQTSWICRPTSPKQTEKIEIDRCKTTPEAFGAPLSSSSSSVTCAPLAVWSWMAADGTSAPHIRLVRSAKWTLLAPATGPAAAWRHNSLSKHNSEKGTCLSNRSGARIRGR